jgi:hypothetical protein
MKHIKLFESFNEQKKLFAYIANNEAEKLIKDNSKNLVINECFYSGSGIDNLVTLLESNGFISPEDFLVTEEAGSVKTIGLKDDVLHVEVSNHKYAYGQKEGDLDISDIARKFEKMLQFSTWRALNWLKKHTVLIKGGKNQEQIDIDKLEENEKAKNYMFFENVQLIKEFISKIEAIDKSAIDQLLERGHDWATDHISTAKDDVEEVCNFLCTNVPNDIVIGVKEAVDPKLQQYTGKRIKLTKMGVDPRSGKPDPNPIPPGTEGTVIKVDDMGTLHVKWDNGRSLGIVPEVDKFTIIAKK